MTKFTFILLNPGTPEQCIQFRPDDGESVIIPVPGEVFSDDPEEGFRQRYAILVREGLIRNIAAVWVPPEPETTA